MTRSDKAKLGAVFIFIALLVFWIKGCILLDPDFGWRVRSGGLILTEGIQKTDPFTYSMPSFPWVDHAWIISVVFAFFYPMVGRVGLSFMLALIAFCAIILSVSRKGETGEKILAKKSLGGDYRFLGSVSFLLSLSVILPYFGIRAQVVSWLMLAVFLRVLFDNLLWKKWRFAVPPFFLIWANLHGGFASGLMILLFVKAVGFFGKRKVNTTDLIVIAASFIFTLANPYGKGAWLEVWSSISDSSLRWSINEWMPAFFSMNFPLLVYIALSSSLIVRYKRKFAPEELALFFIFLLQGILSTRHIPLWIIISAPVLSSSLGYFYYEVSKDKIALSRFAVSYRYLFIVVLFLFMLQLILSMSGSKKLSESSYYPREAINYLRSNETSGELFSNYNWGGYLIWKYPEKKVYIDGRMPSWRWDGAPEKESGAAYDEYKNILTGESDYRLVFEKYGVDSVLWFAPRQPSAYGLITKKLENLLLRPEKEEEFDFIDKLKEDGWLVVYQDDIAVVYRKNN